MRRTRFALAVALCLFGTSAATALDSITFSVSGTWIGNGYTQDRLAVTGSEGFPIDAAVGAGTTFVLQEQFLFQGARLTVSPHVTLGWRNYLLYASGRAVPTQFETALGDEEGVPGIALVRVITLRAAGPFAVEFDLSPAAHLSAGLSPTMLLRLPGGAPIQDEFWDQFGALGFLYSWFRFFAPELHLGATFDLSPYFSFGLRSVASLSLYDVVESIFDFTGYGLPFWDQARVGIYLEFTARPPFDGLFRARNPRNDTLPTP